EYKITPCSVGQILVPCLKNVRDLALAYNICINNGRVGMITIPNWMFLSSFEDIRKLVVSETFIENFVHNGRGVWGSDFGSCSFVFKKTKIPKAKGSYKRLFHKPGSVASNNELIERFFNFPEYYAMSEDFKSIPGSPIAYWASEKVFDAFKNNPKLKQYLSPKQGTSTGNDDVYVRFWFEVGVKKIGLGLKSLDDALSSDFSYFPLDKGGDFRRWYGNNEKVIRFGDGGYEDLLDMGNHLPSRDKYFKKGLTWSKITSFKISVRYDDYGFVFSSVGLKGFPDDSNMYICLGYMNSSLVDKFTEITSPTVSIISGDIEKLPYIESLISKRELESGVISLVDISKHDWDSKELSWGFKNQELLSLEHHQLTLDATYQRLRAHWLKMVMQMQHLEHENNRLFIEAYGLQDELTPDVPLSEITLTCNPHYRYGGNLTDEEREARLQSDTICELISYVIGCMMGRYSLDREGLVYAHGGNEGFKALVEEGAYATFAADEDGILPLSTDSWFEDDVATRLEAFVCTVWGTETLEENLQFIADSLCLAAIKPVKKGGETSRETLRRYLSTQFYKDHLKTYKKRPIYWLFSSGKEKAFECLVYLHRYNEATLPRMRTEYVTPLLGQMAGRIERLRLQQTEASTSDAKRIGKEIDSLTKQLSELRAFDDQLKHHADMRITLDLDDGVKVNYGKFGSLLSDVKAITGDKGE
ncbi:BREX-1 system adenine-specific DNA-methyltransferase PglX, partial [Aeromonas veronii]|uniref:BREX-1 system adenine-specific DNA-methyltransferase PglX n=1 Tax=Aeromonas veronii TaxID=654 RepID=UPI00214D7E72